MQQRSNEIEKVAFISQIKGGLARAFSGLDPKKSVISATTMNKARAGAKSVREARASESMADFMKRHQ